MKTKLTRKQYTLVASMLFGLFFGAGNLIFPIILGAKSGASLIPALCGMLITAVGLPLLGIIALGVSRSSGLMQMSGRVSGWYSYFFTCALYLTIGRVICNTKMRGDIVYNGYSAPYIRQRNTYTGSVYDAVLCSGTVFRAETI